MIDEVKKFGAGTELHLRSNAGFMIGIQHVFRAAGA
jgi:hypothetical protein